MSASPNLVSRFTGFFLAHKQLTAVLLLLVIAGGSMAALSLRREGFPQVPAKVVVITTVYRGAAPAEVEQSITNSIESAVKDLSEVKSTTSTSGESFSSVVAMLDEKADVDSSVQEINSKISGLELPKEAEKPDILVPTTG